MKNIYSVILLFLMGLNLYAQTSVDTGRTTLTAYTFDGTWSPGDPNGISTGDDDIFVTSGNASITADTSIGNVTVSPGAALTVDAGATLTASMVSLESNSDSYSSLISSAGSINGDIEYKRHVNGTVAAGVTTGGNDLISAPLTGQTFEDFQLANDNIVSNTGETLFLFGPLDSSTNVLGLYSNTETATLDPGVGYRAAADGTNGGTFTFNGDLNTGDVSANILNSGTNAVQWNLIGNPYPTYLSVQDFLNHEVATGVKNIDLMTSTSSGIYGYKGDLSTGYTIYNLINIDETTLIAPGQGFYVSADAADVAAHDIVFTPDMRRTGTGDDFIEGRSTTVENKYLQLRISNSSKTFDTEFYFSENASLGLDPGYDAALFGDAAPAFSIYSELVEENTGRFMAIQCMGMTDMNDVSVPLGVNAAMGQQISFSINQSTLPAYIDVYLDDTLNNTYTKLNTGNYTLTSSTAINGTGRFFLRFANSTLGTAVATAHTVEVYSVKDKVIIKGRLDQNSTFMLYDIQGRLIMETKLNQNATNQYIDVSSMPKGTYIVKLSSATLLKTQKLILN
ncbi:T9SS type A sorting domain-containing protein [Subsaximicrobium wynnwilliamsii]|uniref:T9SS type A sorting domain-containing protein n=1 Tax=Subsaximicrobium wynnwilliamsii TaxID=291179 RepID=A0A5C6ZH67_9FLAO|nr:T9SS type A sorting domain-containing protein [Subsaximicrobium wynnwilliamsii]TXD81347.1 T9SS type A sorting domain-containing protein [Subsaximicrobium wynnwilliamsii]TXD89043.1 T9SS type A sorting domain-containing protein [Subsaximicrobium wynnwilliamsii]TXE00721.1 T9SS type A sorting domain-containing protein [Subsaximicrobium wynnwilliamsii]